MKLNWKRYWVKVVKGVMSEWHELKELWRMK